MITVKRWSMRSLSSKLLVLLLAGIPLYAQLEIPTRFSMKSALQDTFLSEGLLSNIVAEIRLMGDSLTWFGTGQGLALHDGHRMYAYQTSADSLDLSLIHI